MRGGIFLIKDDDSLVEMNEQAYESEGILQDRVEDVHQNISWH